MKSFIIWLLAILIGAAFLTILEAAAFNLGYVRGKWAGAVQAYEHAYNPCALYGKWPAYKVVLCRVPRSRP